MTPSMNESDTLYPQYVAPTFSTLPPPPESDSAMVIDLASEELDDE